MDLHENGSVAGLKPGSSELQKDIGPHEEESTGDPEGLGRNTGRKRQGAEESGRNARRIAGKDGVCETCTRDLGSNQVEGLDEGTADQRKALVAGRVGIQPADMVSKVSDQRSE